MYDLHQILICIIYHCSDHRLMDFSGYYTFASTEEQTNADVVANVSRATACLSNDNPPLCSLPQNFFYSPIYYYYILFFFSSSVFLFFILFFFFIFLSVLFHFYFLDYWSGSGRGRSFGFYKIIRLLPKAVQSNKNARESSTRPSS